MREIRTLRSRWRGLETGRRKLPRQSSTLRAFRSVAKSSDQAPIPAFYENIY